MLSLLLLKLALRTFQLLVLKYQGLSLLLEVVHFGPEGCSDLGQLLNLLFDFVRIRILFFHICYLTCLILDKHLLILECLLKLVI